MLYHCVILWSKLHLLWWVLLVYGAVTLEDVSAQHICTWAYVVEVEAVVRGLCWLTTIVPCLFRNGLQGWAFGFKWGKVLSSWWQFVGWWKGSSGIYTVLCSSSSPSAHVPAVALGSSMGLRALVLLLLTCILSQKQSFLWPNRFSDFMLVKGLHTGNSREITTFHVDLPCTPAAALEREPWVRTWVTKRLVLQIQVCFQLCIAAGEPSPWVSS